MNFYRVVVENRAFFFGGSGKIEKIITRAGGDFSIWNDFDRFCGGKSFC